jgi:hypothetical protein
LELPQHLTQLESRLTSSKLKLPEREADNSPASSAKVKNEWSFTPTPPHVFMAVNSVSARTFARGSVMVRTLCYKPEGHVFDSR